MTTTIVNLSLPVDNPNRVINIQGYQAESYSETPSQPNFDSIDIGGRSSPIAYYSGGSARTISFSMLFHRDMVAPWTSAGTYGGMPAGIESDESQYAGLYLGENTQGMTIEEMQKKFVQDYINNVSSSAHQYLYFDETTGSFNVFDKYGEQQKIKVKRKLGINTANQKVFLINGKEVIATYNNQGNIVDIQSDYYITTSTVQTQNLKAEANATARFHTFLDKLKALNYPIYTSNGIIPPKVYLKIGGDNSSGLGGLRLKGYCTTSINYDGQPISHNSLLNATVDFSFTEVVDVAWSASEIITGMERYTKYMDPIIR